MIVIIRCFFAHQTFFISTRDIKYVPPTHKWKRYWWIIYRQPPYVYKIYWQGMSLSVSKGHTLWMSYDQLLMCPVQPVTSSWHIVSYDRSKRHELVNHNSCHVMPLMYVCVYAEWHAHVYADMWANRKISENRNVGCR